MTVYTKAVVQEIRRRGLDIEPMAAEAGLDMRVFNRKEAWIPFIKYATLLKIAARETGDEFFGLHAAAQLDPRDLGALGYIGLASRTLGDALGNTGEIPGNYPGFIEDGAFCRR